MHSKFQRSIFQKFNELFWNEELGFYAYTLDGDKEAGLLRRFQPWPLPMVRHCPQGPRRTRDGIAVELHRPVRRARERAGARPALTLPWRHCSLETPPARSRNSRDKCGKPTHVSLRKADDTVEATGESTRWYRRGRGSSIQGKIFRDSVGKLPWAAGTAYNLQRLFSGQRAFFHHWGRPINGHDG
jgi:hypothetical protein